MASFIPRSGKSYELPKGYVGVTEGELIDGDLNWDPTKKVFTLAHPNHSGQDIGNFYAVVRKIKREYKTTISMNNNISVLGVITRIPKGYIAMIGDDTIVQEDDLYFTRDTHSWMPTKASQIGKKSMYNCLARKYREKPKEHKEKPKSRLARIAIKG